MNKTIRHILVPIDFSARSTRVMDYARVVASSLGAEAHLVHAIEEPFTSAASYRALPDTPARRERLYEQTRVRLSQLANTLRLSGVETTVEVRFGDAVEEIVKAAVDYGADLVVIGSQGRSAMQQLLAGGVSDQVIRRAPCPVLAVRQDSGGIASAA
jgi:nucleotide-binding universal stress UspA family protein